MVQRDVVVIGGSAGAIEALQRMVGGLDERFSAAIFIVIHTAAGSSGFLPQILQRATSLPAAHASDGEPIVAGHIYIAPPDHHLLVGRSAVRITKGPKENGFRPAVDPLFRTAAEAYGSRVIGIVLSGGQDDGTSGLTTIKNAGGLTIVQNPLDALVSSMPESALQYVDVDHIANADEIPSLLNEHASRFMEKPKPKRDREKPDVAEVGTDALSSGSGKPGPPSVFICPQCGGPLWEKDDNGLLKFRCHVGHSFTGESLLEEQADALEQAMWTALRALEEGSALRTRMATHARGRRMFAIAERYRQQADELQDRASVVRKVLVNDRLTPGEDAPAGQVEERARRAEKD